MLSILGSCVSVRALNPYVQYYRVVSIYACWQFLGHVSQCGHLILMYYRVVTLETYKTKLKSETGSADHAGICLRWILGTVVEDKQILLIAQVRFYTEQPTQVYGIALIPPQTIPSL